MKHRIALLLVVSLVTNSCKKEKEPVKPILDFTYSGNVGTVPVTVDFDATVSNSSTVAWAFGDGGTGKGTSVSHVYNEMGVYSVEAQSVSEEGGYTKTIKKVGVSPYTHIAVSSIAFSSASSKPGGGPWDSGSGTATYPDIYIKVYNSSGTLVNTGTTYMNNTLSGTYFISPTVFLYNLTSNFTVKMYDYDSGSPSDELIATFTFCPSDYFTSTLPFTPGFNKSSSGSSVNVYVSWI